MDILFAISQGTLLWQPINFGGHLQASKLTTFTLWPIIKELSRILCANDSAASF